jgi:hypothetical protein
MEREREPTAQGLILPPDESTRSPRNERILLMASISMSALKKKLRDEPTWRCHQNPFIGDLGIQEPVILGEPQILTVNR